MKKEIIKLTINHELTKLSDSLASVKVIVAKNMFKHKKYSQRRSVKNRSRHLIN